MKDFHILPVNILRLNSYKPTDDDYVAVRLISREGFRGKLSTFVVKPSESQPKLTQR